MDHKFSRTSAGGELLAPGHSPFQGELFKLEREFYDRADDLRSQYERRASSLTALATSDNPFVYVCEPKRYEHLAAEAERLFDQDALFHLVDRLRAWARVALGNKRASTPRLSIYVKGSKRSLLRDKIRAKYHYMFCLTGKTQPPTIIRLLSTENRESIGVRAMTTAALSFNQLLVHDVEVRYGLEKAPPFSDPASGAIFLEGYYW